MAQLDALKSLLDTLRQYAIDIGFLVAGLMVAIYCIVIMLTTSRRVGATQNRWEHLETVLICAALIAGVFPLLSLVEGLGKLI